MTALVFVDTNVLAYSRDTAAGAKRVQASDWLVEIGTSALPRASYQVLIELYNTVTRRLAHPLEIPDARELIAGVLDWNPLQPTAALLAAAWAVQDRFGLSWWDAQIVAAAQLQRCAYLLTEDLQHGQKFGTVEVVSPFEVTAAEVFAR